MMRASPVSVCLLLLTGCVWPGARKMNDLRLGMTKQEVLDVMGPPVGTGAEGKAEFLYYKLDEQSFLRSGGYLVPYVVKLVEGRVEYYGRQDGLADGMDKEKHKQ